MAEFPVFTSQDVATFSGRSLASFPPYTDQAIVQAILLFQLGTCLVQMPDDPLENQLATMGILAMADDLILTQPFKKAAASPFNSESIGSYSYSKVAGRASATATAVAKGDKTGVTFFDMALDRLSVCGLMGSSNVPSSGGIEVFEHDAPVVTGSMNNTRMVSPRDQRLWVSYGLDPSQPLWTENIYGVRS